MNSQTLFKKLSLFGMLAIPVLSVLLVLPTTDSFIEHTKTYTLLFGAVLTLLLFVIKTFKDRAMRITVSPLTGALVFFGLTVGAATFFSADYPVEGLLGLGGVLLSTTIIALFGGSLLPKDSADYFVKTLTATSAGLVVLTLLQMVGFGPAQLINQALGVNLPTSTLFNVTGSPFVALQVVGVTLLTVLYTVATTKKLSKFNAVMIPVLLVGVGIYGWAIMPGKEASLRLPSYAASWSVMLDTIRAPRSAIIGAGTHSYRNAYQIFKPLWVNGTESWALAFNQAANMLFTVVTTMGLLGLTAWVFVLGKFASFQKQTLVASKPVAAFVGITFLLNLIFPFNTVMLTLQALGLAVLVANEKHRLPLLQMYALKFKMLNKPETLQPGKKPFNATLYATTGVALVAVLFLGYLVTRSYQGHVVMAQSSRAIAENELVQAYELQQEAVALNPYLDTFRRRYSATSALIAIALSNKADITEQEQQQVSALLQQSVTQARAATTLDGAESQNWSNLAQIYSNLIGVSEDAVDWAVQSYVTAIETNPNDPLIRLDLASVFVGQEAYQQALGIYDQAINIKPDLAISHFRRGQLLQLVGSPESLRAARGSYQTALVLLDADSEDYVTVNQVLEELEAFMEENDIPLVEEEVTGEESPLAEEANTAPSITEQNLNNPDTIAPDEEPVELDAVVPPTEETTEVPAQTEEEPQP